MLTTAHLAMVFRAGQNVLPKMHWSGTAIGIRAAVDLFGSVTSDEKT